MEMHRTALLIAAAATAFTALADSPVVQAGRYMALIAAPTAAQVDPLAEIVTLAFPPLVRDVGGAVGLLLSPSGYRLAPPEHAGPELATVLALPLPDVQRRLGPLSRLDALQVLAGPALRVVVDRRHRWITVEPLPAWRVLGGAP